MANVTEPTAFALSALVAGVVATLVMDARAWLQTRLIGTPSLDYALVGRWLGHMPAGIFRHDPIGRSPPVRGEAVTGWTAHYAIGVAFAAALLALVGSKPTLTECLLMGLATSAAPFLVMQPAFGFGVAAARLPRPAVARANTLLTHLVFGLGLFLGARVRVAA